MKLHKSFRTVFKKLWIILHERQDKYLERKQNCCYVRRRELREGQIPGHSVTATTHNFNGVYYFRHLMADIYTRLD